MSESAAGRELCIRRFSSRTKKTALALFVSFVSLWLNFMFLTSWNHKDGNRLDGGDDPGEVNRPDFRVDALPWSAHRSKIDLKSSWHVFFMLMVA